MLLTLCLLVLRLHAPTSGAFGVPSEHGVAARSGGAPASTAIESAAVVSARAEAAHRDGWLRAPERHFALASSRVAPPFSLEIRWRSSATRLHTPTADASSSPRAANAAVHVSLRVRALDSSREPDAWGGLLAYYPTAPPLQG